MSQPLHFPSRGKQRVVPRTDIDVQQEEGQLQLLGGTDLQTLVRGLNRIGLKPSGIIAILQAIKQAGALQATLVVK